MDFSLTIEGGMKSAESYFLCMFSFMQCNAFDIMQGQII